MPRATKPAAAKATSKPTPSRIVKGVAKSTKPTPNDAAGKARAATAHPGKAKAGGTSSKASQAVTATASSSKRSATAKTSVAKTPAAKAPAHKPARRAKSPFSAKFLAAQEKALVEERSTYLRQSESLRAEADSLVADFESGDVQFDEESGEGDTLNIERERDLALSAQARAAVEEIDHALAKFATGTYGICEISGEPIPVERLEAIPWARERVEFKTGGLARRS